MDALFLFLTGMVGALHDISLVVYGALPPLTLSSPVYNSLK